MDLKKIQKFNQHMGRQKFSKGGYIKKLGNRKYFDDGGIASGTATSGPGSGGTNTAQGLAQNASNLLGINAVGANVTPGTNSSQLNAAYTNAQSGINQQQNLVNTLTPQAAAGVNAQNQVEAQELAMAKGQGPNPAEAELAQTTGQNVNQEAALLAGQRGASNNVGLAARNIGQQGAATQQQAVGQAATLEAQQQIAAQNNAAQIANNQIGQTAGVTTGLNTAAQNEQNILQNANTSMNNANVGMQSNLNSVNAATNSNILGGITSGLSGPVSSIGSMLNKGGSVGNPTDNIHGHKKLDFVHKMAKLGLQHFDDGGNVQPTPTPVPQSYFGQSAQADTAPVSQGKQEAQDSMRKAFNYDSGGEVDEGNYTASAPSSGPNVSGAPTETPISFGGSSSSGGGGGGGGLGVSAALAYKGGVMQKMAKGGEPMAIGPNPLLTAIQTPPGQMNYAGQYTSSGASSGPNVSGAPNEPSVYSQKSGSKAQSNPLAGASSMQGQDDTEFGGSSLGDSGVSGLPGAAEANNLDLTMNAAKGGGIWNLHPSQHAEYSAKHFANYFSGGKSKEVKAMVSPGERYWTPGEVEQIKHGADPMKLGRIFPGKDKVPGKDSLKNDTVPTTLEEGGIVNPLHIEKTKNPDKARLFVLKSLRATGRHMKKPGSMK